MISPKKDVDVFLVDVKNAIKKGNVQPVERKKNMQTLASIGITWDDAIDVISSLSYSNYKKGPEEDRDRPGTDDFWFFKKNEFGCIIYIKIKILYKKDRSLLVVSFHIDE